MNRVVFWLCPAAPAKAMRTLRRVGAAALLASAVWAQNPADISLMVAAKGGKSQFRLGEPIEVELRFQSSAAGKYQVWTTETGRYTRQTPYDEFFIEPSQGVVDPLQDIFAQIGGGAIVGRPPEPAAVGDRPVAVELAVNQWLAIRQPGHYRIAVETTRVVTGAETGAFPGNPGTAVPLRSAALEIDVVAAEPGWAESQLKEAVAVLERGDAAPPQRGQMYDLNAARARDAEAAHAALVIRCLETPEAARAMVRFFEHGPQAAQQDLRAGLFASPWRKEAITALDEAIGDPAVAVTNYFLGTRIEFAMLASLGPKPAYTAKTPEEIQRWVREVDMPYEERAKPIREQYYAVLAEAVAHKQGKALAISLETLVGPGAPSAPPSAVKALGDNFALLPEPSQNNLLTMNWPRIASPAMEPLVRSLAEGRGPLRDPALVRLNDLNPDAARRIILERVRTADISGSLDRYRSYRVLLTLPDKTLPDADDALIAAGQQGKLVDPLIARYASDAALPRLREMVDRNPAAMCTGALMAYFFRVNPAGAASLLARARAASRGPCTAHLSPNEDLLMSPGLERQALDDLASADEMVRGAALTMLERGGSETAKQPLLDAFLRLEHAGIAPADVNKQGSEQGFVSALVRGTGWILTPEQLRGVLAACSSDQCRRTVTAAQKSFEPPIPVSPWGGPLDFGDYSVGSVQVHGRKQLQDRIAQFPKDTPFFIGRGVAGSWYGDLRIREIREVLDATGMKLVDPPPPTPAAR